MTQTTIETTHLQLALERAHRVLWQSQRADGSWESMADIGPWVTAQTLISLKSVDAISAQDTALVGKYLVTYQHLDGSFGIQAYSTRGDLGATAVGWAALHLCQERAAAARAKAWLDANGGIAGVVDKMNEADFSAVFCAMAGLIDPERVPCPITAPLVLPPLEKLVTERFHSGVLMGAFQTEWTLRALRRDFGPDGTHKSFLDEQKARVALQVFKTFQNHNGSWNNSPVITVPILPALRAIGGPEAEAMLQHGLQWLNTVKLYDADGLHFSAYGTEVWSTAFDVRALLVGGVGAADPDVVRALEWMVAAQQTEVPMPKVDNRKANAVLLGGWGFQRDNHTMVDNDDAGVVLTAFGLALQDPALPADVRRKVTTSAELGKRWLYDMQNPDGGWSSFVWGLPGKRPGPIMERPVRIELDNPFSMISAYVQAPPVTGDPSTEDVTARVLHGLSFLGETVDGSPAVAKAVAFLREQQAANGGWWGRWVVNYLSATAFVLIGLKHVGVNLQEPWVQRAVRWVLSKQNTDGGWGEGPPSYRDEGQAGVGPTMLPLTGLVVQALIEVGLGDSEAVRRAVRLLLDTQRADGTWANGEFLHTNIPPDTFYVLHEAARYYPTEALGLYLRHLQQPTGATTPRPKWTDALLDHARTQTDPTADGVIASVFRQHQVDAVNRLMRDIFRTDQGVPAALPDDVERYFEDTALPPWADLAQVRLSEQLFTRAGWQVAMGLFCSALPQAYAAGNGAHVIALTQGMTQHVKQRIFETGQFLFDVLDPGALSNPGGTGIVTAKKVRLMHATVRHLIHTQARPPWDAGRLGQPINQEDLAGTLMTFSVVILDALRLLGVPVSEAEANAYFHTWLIIGHFLGIEPSLLPANRLEGAELMEAIRDRQWRATDDGRVLTKALVELMQDYFPGEALDGFPVALIRTLAGDHCADLLGLPPADWTRALIDAGTQVSDFVPLDAHSPLAKWVEWASHRLMEGIVNATREGKNARFRIPTVLTRTIDPSQ